MSPSLPAPAPPKAHAPIGVFDSGVGGLSVLREIRRALPHETLCYVADSAYAPYGHRSVAYIENRARHIIDFLQTQGVKAVVVACNTVTGLVIQHLRQAFAQLPIVAIEPAIKPAMRHTRNGVVGVLATQQTIASPGLQRLLQTHAQGRQVLLQACPGWAEQVERGEVSGPSAQALVAQYVQPLLDEHVDTLVLGCTHYPFLAPLIQHLAGPGVTTIDPAPAVAQELARRLAQLQLLAPNTQIGRTDFWSSAPPHQTEGVLSTLWGETVHPNPLPALQTPLIDCQPPSCVG